MNFNLKMLNLWIGMCRGAAGLPKELRSLGYIDKWIEYCFANQDLDRVCPDLMISSDEEEHSILLEFKSGANIEGDQMRRYSRITIEDLRTKAFLSRESTDSFDITIVGKDEHQERLIIGIDSGGHQFPLLSEHQEGLSLVYNQFINYKLNKIFSPRLKINLDKITSRFVPIDQESDLWEVAEVVMPKIIHYMTERRPRISVEEVCQAAFVTWDIIGPLGKDQIKAKIRTVFQEASSYFQPFLRWHRRTNSLDIIENPLDLDTDKRTAAYRRLRTMQKTFLDRLKSGRVVGQLEMDFQ